MPHPMPKAVRERCVKYVEAGHSCREAARKYDVSASFVIKLMALWRDTGSLEPRPRGGFRHSKLKPHQAFILETVKRQSDITMPELAARLAEARGTEVVPSTLSRFLIGSGLSFKKNSKSHRTGQA